MFTLFTMSFFRAAHDCSRIGGGGGGGGGKKSPLPKICHTYPTMMKWNFAQLYLA